MICRNLHDLIHDIFGRVDAKEYCAALKQGPGSQDWSQLFGIDPERDQALLHAAECDDCLDDILSYLEIRDTVDYRKYPCIHLAYYSSKEEVRCIDNDHGFFSILLPGKEASGIGIGCCPWCGVPFPTSYTEMHEAKELGLGPWQKRQMGLCQADDVEG